MSMLGSVTQLTGTNVEAQRQESFALLGQISTFSRGWCDRWRCLCFATQAVIQCLVAVLLRSWFQTLSSHFFSTGGWDEPLTFSNQNRRSPWNLQGLVLRCPAAFRFPYFWLICLHHFLLNCPVCQRKATKAFDAAAELDNAADASRLVALLSGLVRAKSSKSFLSWTLAKLPVDLGKCHLQLRGCRGRHGFFWESFHRRTLFAVQAAVSLASEQLEAAQRGSDLMQVPLPPGCQEFFFTFLPGSAPGCFSPDNFCYFQAYAHLMWAELMLALGKTSELKAVGPMGCVVVLESRRHNLTPPTDCDCKL